MARAKGFAAAAAALLLTAASPALAEPPDGKGALPPGMVPEAATPEAIAAAAAEADAIARAGEAQDLFENVTDSAVPALRHRASGVVCHFEPGAAGNEVHVYPPAGLKLPRGDDVSCQTTSLEFVYTLYMTRYPPEVTVDIVLAGSDRAIHQRFPDARPLRGTAISLGLKGGPAPWKTLRYQAKQNGKPIYTRASAMKTGGWTIAHRLTGPLKEMMAGDLLAELNLAAVIGFGGAPPKAP